MKSNEQLRKEFEEQTGNRAIVFPACHGETGYASWEYQLWLEQKLLEEYAQQSQPSGMRWVREKPANDREFVLVTASLINGEWHYHGWEIIEVPDGYFALCELHGEEWGPYEDLSAEYYLVLSPVSESSPAGAAEGASEGMKTENFVSVIERRIDYFNKIHHSYEAKELTYALKSIQRLVPPIMFKTGHFEYSINQPASEGMAEALRLLDTASNLVGNPGTNISSSTDLACDSWQEKYKQFCASLSSPGSGWVKVDKDKLQRLYLIANFGAYSKCDAADLKFLTDMEDEVFPAPPGE